MTGRRSIDDTFSDAVVPILEGIIALKGVDFARKHTAQELIDVIRLDGTRDAIARRYCSLDWWGGAGSMADFIPEGRESRWAFMQLLIQLAEAFGKAGFSCPRAIQWTDIFQRWLDQGVV